MPSPNLPYRRFLWYIKDEFPLFFSPKTLFAQTVQEPHYFL